jgi:Ca2+-binding EF-hand superfamily protein
MRRSFALVLSTALGLTALSGAALAERGHGLFQRWDTNGDGVISKEEAAAGRNAMFNKLDANGDGSIDQAEIEKARAEWRQRMNKPVKADAEADAQGKKHRGFMQRMDTDGDGKISRAEFAAAGEKMFARLDKNGDGKISKDELPKRHKEAPAAPEGGEAPAQ